jgi:hypothetical protein
MVIVFTFRCKKSGVRKDGFFRDDDSKPEADQDFHSLQQVGRDVRRFHKVLGKVGMKQILVFKLPNGHTLFHC